MKNLLKSLLIVAFIAVSFQSNAQIKFGVKAGLNVNNITSSEKQSSYTESYGNAVGFNIGLAVEYGLSDALSIQSGLGLSIKGYKYKEEDTDPTYEYTSSSSLMYLEIPINFAYNVSEKIQLYAGPYVAFGLGGKTKETETDEADYEGTIKSVFGELSSADYAEYKEDEEPLNGLDFGINLGLGFKASENLLINAGYSIGLGNLEPKMEGDDNYGDYKMSNRVISLGATYFF